MIGQNNTVVDYYQHGLAQIRDSIFSTPDLIAQQHDADAWAQELADSFLLEPIVIDQTRFDGKSETLFDLSHEFGPKHQPMVRYQVAVMPTDSLDIIKKNNLSASTYTLSSDVSTIGYDPKTAVLYIDCPADTNEVNQARSRIRQQVQWWNADIDAQNQLFLPKIKSFVQQRISNMKAVADKLASLSASTGLTLRQKADPAKVVTVPLKVKKVIEPLLRPVPQKPAEQNFTLPDDKLSAILELIDNQCRSFERTPTVFARHGEEDLRDIMLSSLNAVFDGGAVGEAFQVLGKADIHLRISKGDFFIAECKFWDGLESLKETTAQVLERLTWRDAHGVVIMFSKNKDFGLVRRTVEESIAALPGAAGPALALGDSQFSARFTLPTDNSKHVEIRFLIYNLFLPRPAGRSKA